MQRFNVFRLVCFSILALMMIGCDPSTESIINEDEGQKIRYAAIRSKVRHLDPGDIADQTSATVASQFYDTLYQYHYLKRPYEIIPSLAVALPEYSEDGLTCTIKIRQDVYFHDNECFTDGVGRLLTVHDLIYAWKRIANIKYLSKQWWIFDGRIVGLDEFRDYTKSIKKKEDVDFSREVAGLVAVNDFTLQIKLKKTWPQLVLYMAHLSTAPMAKEAVDFYADQIINHAVGTGPFMLESWKRGSKIIMVRNPKFRDEFYPSEGQPGDKEKGLLDDAGKKLPFFDKIVFSVIEEDQPYWLLFLQGKIDAAGIPKDFFGQAVSGRELSTQMKEKGMAMAISAEPSTFWTTFNMEDPVVGTNLPLRRAMSLARNRKEYIDVFNNNRGVPAKGFIPPTMSSYNSNLDNPWANYDLDKAKEQLKLAEEIHGGKISLTLSLPGTDTLVRQMGQYFQRSMQAIGLEINVDYMDWPTFQEKNATKDLQLFSMGWVGDIPDAENFLLLFYGPNESPGANQFNYKNPEYDRLYEKVSVMADSPERVALYRKMEEMVLADCPMILTLHRVLYAPHYKYLKNYQPHAFGYGLAKYRNIDLEQRKKLIGR